MKYPEHILAVKANAFRAIIGKHSTFCMPPASKQKVMDAIGDTLILGRRHELELDEEYLQLLPYCVFFQRDADNHVRVFVYNRSKQQGEQRLLGKKSIGVGGHMDFMDVCHTEGVIDVELTFARSTYRELNEEIAIVGSDRTFSFGEYVVGHYAASPQYFGLLLDDSDAVGRVHAGVVHMCEIDAGHTLVCVGDGMVEDGFYPLAKLAEGIAEFESWSQILINALQAIEL